MNRLDETNVCYLCETTHDCSEGNEVKALWSEWVCLSCQDKLISELAPKIKADAIRNAISETKELNWHSNDWTHYRTVRVLLDLEQYANKLEGGE